MCEGAEAGRGAVDRYDIAYPRACLEVEDDIDIAASGEYESIATRDLPAERRVNGTLVRMTFSWPRETAMEFDRYFNRFLVPPHIAFSLNGDGVPSRSVRDSVEATPATEIYNADSHNWKKSRRKTAIELVETQAGEEPFIYEMGIPVASADWSVPFHANVQQRVPMNPNRDALAGQQQDNGR